MAAILADQVSVAHTHYFEVVVYDAVGAADFNHVREV
jgi:hypothetical protein